MYVDNAQYAKHKEIIKARYNEYLESASLLKDYISNLTFVKCDSSLYKNEKKVWYHSDSTIQFYIGHYMHLTCYNIMQYAAEKYANQFILLTNSASEGDDLAIVQEIAYRNWSTHYLSFGKSPVPSADLAYISQYYHRHWNGNAIKRARNILVNRYGITMHPYVDALMGVKPVEKIPKTTILFLDIDGVLNSTSGAIRRFGWDEGYELHDENIKPFIDLITQFEDLQIVISSAWRTRYHGDFAKFAARVFAGYPEIRSRIIGLTPRLPDRIKDHDSRGVEIMRWLYNYVHGEIGVVCPVPRVIVIDDEHIDLAVKKWTFYIDGRVGFNYVDMYEIAKLAKEGEFDFPPILKECPKDCALNVKPDVTTK